MDRRDDEKLPDELRETADWMRESRTQPTALRLDELKQRAFRQAERSRGRGALGGLSARWRIRVVTSLLVVGLMMTSLTGVVLATGGTGGSFSLHQLLQLLTKPKKDPSHSQYCPPNNHGDDDDDGGHHGDDDDDGGYYRTSTTTGGGHHGDDDDDGRDCIPCPTSATSQTFGGHSGGGHHGDDDDDGGGNPCDPKPGCGPDKTDGVAGNSGRHSGQPPKDDNRGDCPNPPGHNKPPSATTGGASNVGKYGATLSGTVNPNGTNTTAVFQYGKSSSSVASGGSQSVGNGTTAKGVSTTISGLQKNTTYYFRVVGSSSKGTTYGAPASFTTKSY